MSRVLSIQSHVVFGYVGGKAAVFPLQCLGYDVDVVNTVSFSNHSGYGRFGGTRATADELNALFESMEQNELLMPNRLLTGYIPGAEPLKSIEKLARKLKHTRPSLIYLLDPVLGDAGRLYVSPDVIPIYREMLPLATIITPNWFEVEVLTETPLNDIPSLHRALKILHNEYHVPNIVISSILLKPWLLSVLPPSIRPQTTSNDDQGTNHLLCISSSISPESFASSEGDNQNGHLPSMVHAGTVPLIPGYFSGVGDLFSALVLAHFHPPSPSETLPDPSLPSASSPPSSTSTPLSISASYSLYKTHTILKLTQSLTHTLPEEDRQPTDDELDKQDPLRKTRRMRGRELALVKGQDIIRGEPGTGGDVMKPWIGFWDEPSSEDAAVTLSA